MDTAPDLQLSNEPATMTGCQAHLKHTMVCSQERARHALGFV